MHRRRPTILLALPLLALLGCADGTQATLNSEASAPELVVLQDSDRIDLPSLIVPLSWWRAHQQDANLILVDARSPEEYALSHLPGAINLNYEDTYDRSEGRHWHIADQSTISGLFSSKGITMGQTVVIYGDAVDFKGAARLFWVFEVFGHPSVGVLNTNTDRFVNEGGRLQTSINQLPTSQFIGEIQPGRLVSKLEVKQGLREDSTLLLDTRPHEHFLGEDGWEGLKYWGRIPGSISLPPEDFYDRSGFGIALPNVQELPSVYEEYATSNLITYCNAGHEATVSYLYFRSIGANVAVYDGSWPDWSSDPSLPRTSGPATTSSNGAQSK